MIEPLENVDKLHFDCGNMPDLFQRLASESETAQILIFSSFLEDKVLSLIKLRLFHLDSVKAEDAIFGSNGPLGTFGSRIALSYQLGWLSPRQKKKLDAFRKIRNEFAHNAFQIRMADKRISDLFGVIDYDVYKFLTPIRAALVTEGEEDPIISDDKITIEQKFLCNLAILADNTFVDFMILPSALAYQVNPNDVLGNYDEGSEIVKGIRRALSETILNILVRPNSVCA